MTTQTSPMAPATTIAANQNAAAVNDIEFFSIRSLVAYKADQAQVSEDVVRDMLSTRFGVAEVSRLHSTDYDDIMRYLVDLQIGVMVN